MSCLLISERIMRDKIAQGVQEGEVGGPRATHGPTPQLLKVMAIENLRQQQSPRKRKKKKERGGMGKNRKERIQGERREA